jgi:mRNA interferase RelE/StbE
MQEYSIKFYSSYKKDLKKILRKELQLIFEKINSLGIDPYQSGTKKLSGTRDLFRARSGDYRIIYEIIDKEIVVMVIKIGHRSDV